MLKRLVRAYFRLRYFPRTLVGMLQNISVAISDLHAQRQTSYLRSASSLENVHAETAAFFDEATRQMMGVNVKLNALAAQTEAVRLAVRQVQDEAASPAGTTLPHAPGGPDPQFGPSLDHVRTLLSEFAAETRREIAALKDIERARPREQVRLFPSAPWSAEAAGKVLATLAWLSPTAVQGVGKVRVGRDQDGGYVMLDDFAGVTTALSLGIGDDASWDADVAARGIRVLQSDPSAERAPTADERLVFEPLRIAGQDQDGALSIAGVLARHAVGPDEPLLLKIDIEGAEWDVLRAADEAVLGRFRQVVCEFHDLDRLGEPEFGARAAEVFAKLARTHLVSHVHGNNRAGFANVANVMVPQSLEVSFALRQAYRPSLAPLQFPTPLDRPNEPGRADLYLGSFRFGPHGAADQTTDLPEPGLRLASGR